MKTALTIIVTFCIALLIGWLIWGRQTPSTPAKFVPVAHAPATAPVPPLPNRPAASNLPLPSEWQQLRTVRDTTLQNNPDLAAEYKSLMGEMDQQQKDLDAAMIKADPKVAPIVAKLQELRKKNSVNRSTASSN